MKDAHKPKAVEQRCGAGDVVGQIVWDVWFLGAQFYFVFIDQAAWALKPEAALGHVFMEQGFYFCWFLKVPRSIVSPRELCGRPQRHFYYGV